MGPLANTANPLYNQPPKNTTSQNQSADGLKLGNEDQDDSDEIDNGEISTESNGKQDYLGPLSLKQGPQIPMEQGPLPGIKQGTLTTEQGPLPGIKQGSLTTEQLSGRTPSPRENKPVQLKQGPIAGIRPLPVIQHEPLAMRQGPVPGIKHEPLAMRQGPVPSPSTIPVRTYIFKGKTYPVIEFTVTASPRKEDKFPPTPEGVATEVNQTTTTPPGDNGSNYISNDKLSENNSNNLTTTVSSFNSTDHLNSSSSDPANNQPNNDNGNRDNNTSDKNSSSSSSEEIDMPIPVDSNEDKSHKNTSKHSDVGYRDFVSSTESAVGGNKSTLSSNIEHYNGGNKSTVRVPITSTVRSQQMGLSKTLFTRRDSHITTGSPVYSNTDSHIDSNIPSHTSSHTTSHTSNHTPSHPSSYSTSHTSSYSSSHPTKIIPSHSSNSSSQPLNQTPSHTQTHTPSHTSSHTPSHTQTHTPKHTLSHTQTHTPSHTTSHTPIPPIVTQTEHAKPRPFPTTTTNKTTTKTRLQWDIKSTSPRSSTTTAETLDYNRDGNNEGEGSVTVKVSYTTQWYNKNSYSSSSKGTNSNNERTHSKMSTTVHSTLINTVINNKNNNNNDSDLDSSDINDDNSSNNHLNNGSGSNSLDGGNGDNLFTPALSTLHIQQNYGSVEKNVDNSYSSTPGLKTDSGSMDHKDDDFVDGGSVKDKLSNPDLDGLLTPRNSYTTGTMEIAPENDGKKDVDMKTGGHDNESDRKRIDTRTQFNSTVYYGTIYPQQAEGLKTTESDLITEKNLQKPPPTRTLSTVLGFDKNLRKDIKEKESGFLTTSLPAVINNNSYTESASSSTVTAAEGKSVKKEQNSNSKNIPLDVSIPNIQTTSVNINTYNVNNSSKQQEEDTALVKTSTVKTSTVLLNNNDELVINSKDIDDEDDDTDWQLDRLQEENEQRNEEQEKQGTGDLGVKVDQKGKLLHSGGGLQSTTSKTVLGKKNNNNGDNIGRNINSSSDYSSDKNSGNTAEDQINDNVNIFNENVTTQNIDSKDINLDGVENTEENKNNNFGDDLSENVTSENIDSKLVNLGSENEKDNKFGDNENIKVTENTKISNQNNDDKDINDRNLNAGTNSDLNTNKSVVDSDMPVNNSSVIHSGDKMVFNDTLGTINTIRMDRVTIPASMETNKKLSNSSKGTTVTNSPVMGNNDSNNKSTATNNGLYNKNTSKLDNVSKIITTTERVVVPDRPSLSSQNAVQNNSSTISYGSTTINASKIDKNSILEFSAHPNINGNEELVQSTATRGHISVKSATTPPTRFVYRTYHKILPPKKSTSLPKVTTPNTVINRQTKITTSNPTRERKINRGRTKAPSDGLNRNTNNRRNNYTRKVVNKTTAGKNRTSDDDYLTTTQFLQGGAVFDRNVVKPFTPTPSSSVTVATTDIGLVGNSTMTSGVDTGPAIGIILACIIAFWIILGPLICIACRLKDKAKQRRSRSQEDEMGTRLVEEMVRMELARGRDKKYQTSVSDMREIEPLKILTENDYENLQNLCNDKSAMVENECFIGYANRPPFDSDLYDTLDEKKNGLPYIIDGNRIYVQYNEDELPPNFPPEGLRYIDASTPASLADKYRQKFTFSGTPTSIKDKFNFAGTPNSLKDMSKRVFNFTGSPTSIKDMSKRVFNFAGSPVSIKEKVFNFASSPTSIKDMAKQAFSFTGYKSNGSVSVDSGIEKTANSILHDLSNLSMGGDIDDDNDGDNIDDDKDISLDDNHTSTAPNDTSSSNDRSMDSSPALSCISSSRLRRIHDNESAGSLTNDTNSLDSEFSCDNNMDNTVAIHNHRNIRLKPPPLSKSSSGNKSFPPQKVQPVKGIDTSKYLICNNHIGSLEKGTIYTELNECRCEFRKASDDLTDDCAECGKSRSVAGSSLSNTPGSTPGNTPSKQLQQRVKRNNGRNEYARLYQDTTV